METDAEIVAHHGKFCDAVGKYKFREIGMARIRVRLGFALVHGLAYMLNKMLCRMQNIIICATVCIYNIGLMIYGNLTYRCINTTVTQTIPHSHYSTNFLLLDTC